MAIDFFSRKLFGKLLTSKESNKTLQFIKEVYEEFKFKTLLTDNGREFENMKVREWAEENGIKHEFSIPHFHPSNGRIERANRTIREAIKKSKGPLKKILKSVISNYNRSFHRGIGMTPDEAVEAENREKVLAWAENYKKEFKPSRNRFKEIKRNDQVLIKNSLQLSKMDKEFDKVGIVTEVLPHDTYRVRTKRGNDFLRHRSQLRELSRGRLIC